MQKKISLYIFMVLSLLGTVHAEIGPTQEKVIKTAKKIGAEVSESTQVFAASILAAIVYGIGNDQITARVCPEYFTEGFHLDMLLHNAQCGDKLAKYMLEVKDPTALGLYWGIFATWWFGALLGVPTVAAARIGSWPKLGIKDLIKPIGVGIASLSGMALAAGSYGYVASKNGWLSQELKNGIQKAWGSWSWPNSGVRDAYTADAFAHHVGYFGGALVACGLVSWIVHERYKRACEQYECAQKQQ